MLFRLIFSFFFRAKCRVENDWNKDLNLKIMEKVASLKEGKNFFDLP